MWLMINAGMFGAIGRLVARLLADEVETYDTKAQARLQKAIDNRMNAERAVDAVCQVYGLPMGKLSDKKFQQAVKAVAFSQGWEIAE